jgi:opacity protein-like surface antigen
MVAKSVTTGSTDVWCTVSKAVSQVTVEGSRRALAPQCNRDLDWLASVTGRVGYAMGRTLLYGMGGVAWSDVHTHVGIGSVPLLSGSAHTGWIAGFGFEYALSSHVSTRIEYAHIDLGERHESAPGGGGTIGQGSGSQNGHHPARRERQALLTSRFQRSLDAGRRSRPAFSYVIPTSENAELAVTP